MKVYTGPFPNKGKKRKLEVTVHKWDCISLDCDLALVILPLLKRFRECNNGSPWMSEQEDIGPGFFRCHLEEESFHQLAWWEAALDAMIDAFQFFVDMQDEDFDCEREFDPVEQARVTQGLMLFGKHYRSLWL